MAIGPRMPRTSLVNPRFRRVVRRGDVADITAAIPPALGALEDGDTIAPAMSANYDQTSNYASTAGAISTIVAAATINGSPALLTDTVEAGDVVAVTVTVTDSEANERVFSAGAQTVADIAPVASGAIADQTFIEGVANTPLDVSADFTGTRLTFALAPSSAALPAGLSLSSAGVISGTPTTVSAEVNIVVRATNAAGTADTAFGVTIVEPLAATGGTETVITQGGRFYRVHTFLAGGTLTVTSGGTAEILLVGGGGSGGSSGPFGGGGGGGAGGLLIGSESLTADSYSIVVGAGGAFISGNHIPGNEGQNSSAFGLTAIGGGRGGSGNNGGPTSGGSGGGQGTVSNAAVDPGNVSGTAGQGNDGGQALPPNGGGGGGAGAPGGTPPDISTAANGGDGLQSSITGTQVYYAGGGAGSGPTSTGSGVTAINPAIGVGGQGGGGGDGSIDGVDGTGGGGAAGLSSVDRSGKGGDGIVIVRYEIPEADYLEAA